MTMTSIPINILLVEDNEGDARLALEVLKEGRILNKVYLVVDGVEAMAFLRKEGAYADAPSPHLILLDLNLPRKDGREVLAEIKSDECLKKIPVVVLSTSSDEDDIFRTYNLHANCFITKSIDFEQFLRVIRSIEDFWLTVVQLPGEGSSKG
jgi:two-component system, chemotaxis family, response regulator Rcp1